MSDSRPLNSEIVYCFWFLITVILCTGFTGSSNCNRSILFKFEVEENRKWTMSNKGYIKKRQRREDAGLKINTGA